jgi:hypothetical protein
MTQYPGYPAQQPSYYTPQASPRPTSVTVLAIIGIIWGALQLLCNAFGIFGLLMLDQLTAAGGGANPMADAMKDSPGLMPILIGAVVVRLVLSLVLLAGSIGALSLKAWGRSAMLGYAWGIVVVTILETIVGLTMTLPAVKKHLPADPQLQQTMMAQQYGSVLCGPILGLIYPVFVLVYMNKPHVKAAFAGTGGTTGMGGGGYGGGYPGAAAGMYPPPQQPPPPPGGYPPQGPYSQ